MGDEEATMMGHLEGCEAVVETSRGNSYTGKFSGIIHGSLIVRDNLRTWFVTVDSIEAFAFKNEDIKMASIKHEESENENAPT